MSEMKNLIIDGVTYEIVDDTARKNSSIEIPKIYKWEKRKSGLDSYTTGASQTLSGNFTSLTSVSDSYATGYKTVKDAFERLSDADTYKYIGKTSINSEYPYIYLKSYSSSLINSGTCWPTGVYKITSISIVKSSVKENYLTYNKYTYNITGQLLSDPVYIDEFIGYKYGLSIEDVQLFSTDNNVSYTLTNPD